jgi:hypothetical protein
MPLVYITAAVGVVAIWRLVSSALRRRYEWRVAVRAAAIAVAALFVLAPAVTANEVLVSSYPGLWVNSLSGNRVGYFFPHDEYYDLGARESIRYIAEHADRGDRLASEIPGVVQYYLERFNREDIRSEILSQPGFDFNENAPKFVLLQRGRVYFENTDVFKYIEENFPVVHQSAFVGGAAARVFRLDGTEREW